MCAQIINSIGLVLSIAGTIMVFIWGVTLERESFGLGLEDKTLVNTKWGRITVEEAAVKSRLERKHHQYLSKLGLALIGVGFLLQLVAVWLVCY